MSLQVQVSVSGLVYIGRDGRLGQGCRRQLSMEMLDVRVPDPGNHIYNLGFESQEESGSLRVVFPR